VPFALSRAINKTVDAAQDAVQAALPAEFHLRRAPFIEQTIYRKPGQDFATKTNLAGVVRVNPERNFLAKFEDGGEKQSIAGKSLAVPIMRQADRDLIIRRGDPLSVKMLMASIQLHKGKVLRFRNLRKKGQVKITVDPNRVFLVKNAKGTFILQRVGTGSAGNRVLYWFRKDVPIPDSLHFDEIALKTALATWDANMADAIEFAMATAL
jgi:hypothetical protein